MKNIISCCPASYGKYRDQAYQHLAKIGVEYVELPIPKLEDIQGVLEELDRHGLSVATIQVACNIQSGNMSDQFKVPLEVAEQMSVKRIFVSVRTGGMEKETAYRRLRILGDLAAQSDVIIILETHPDIVTNGDVGRSTMEGVNHPNIRINFDTANIYYYNEGVNEIEEMMKILDYIEGVHLKDTNGKPGTWYFPTLGEGIVDFEKVREVLNSRGFFGPFTIENEGIKGENLSLEQTLERMDKSVSHLRKCGF